MDRLKNVAVWFMAASLFVLAVTFAVDAGQSGGKSAPNSGVDIGDVDILSIAAGDNNIGNVDIVHAILGAQADAAVTTDTNAALNQHVRGLVVLQKAASTDINAAVTADVDAAVAASAGLRLKGFSCRESAATAAAATFQIVDGATGAAAGKVFTVELTANESRSEWLGPEGINCANGISIDWIAGTVDVYLHYADVE